MSTHSQYNNTIVIIHMYIHSSFTYFKMESIFGMFIVEFYFKKSPLSFLSDVHSRVRYMYATYVDCTMSCVVHSEHAHYLVSSVGVPGLLIGVVQKMAKKGITLEDLTEQFKISGSLLELENEVSDDDIRKISAFLETWKLVAPYIGLSEGDVEAINRDGKSEEEKRLMMLQKWKQALVFKATYKELVNALLSVKRADLAMKVCQLVTVASTSLADSQPTHSEGQWLKSLESQQANGQEP